MNALEYLMKRVETVVVDSEKIYNEGARLLANYPHWAIELPHFIDLCWDNLVKCCVRNKHASHSSEVKLTFISHSLGQRLAVLIGEDEDDIKTALSLGDIMLETFLQEGKIEIFRQYEGHAAPYIVRLTGAEADREPAPTLIGTTFMEPAPITNLFSPITGEPYIKGWKSNKLFKEYLGQPFVRALEKMRAVRWELNIPVLEVLKANPPPNFIELVSQSDGEIHTLMVGQSPATLRKKDLCYLDGSVFQGKKDIRFQRVISKWLEYKQIVAKADLVIRQGGTFYQEVSCDYRGRVYYSESFLEYQGADSARSLFLFAEKQPVTNRGKFWLMVQAAVAYNQSYTIAELRKLRWPTTNYMLYLQQEKLDSISVDKMTLQDRYLWAKNNLYKFCQPLPYLCPEAEKPYAFLAICYELYNLERNPDYQSGYPLPIDGANNGWQHLAAISKDREAGDLVSLTKAPIQRDFYITVAKKLREYAAEWFAARDMPMKHVRKGIAKRGAMTRAYTAGKERIAKNMHDDCHAEGFCVVYDIAEEDCSYLAGQLIEAINEVCKGPLRTTKYLQKVVAHQLDAGRNVISWVTPSGFPVVYKAYLQQKRKQRGTIRGLPNSKDGRIMHIMRVDIIAKETRTKVPCRRSFASGISPNFVHSMDAAHLCNTVVAYDGNFAGVHDTFAVHASGVDFLIEVTKATFIAQYDVPNFFDVIDELLITHDRDSFRIPAPELGTLNIEEVNKSDYFFC